MRRQNSLNSFLSDKIIDTYHPYAARMGSARTANKSPSKLSIKTIGLKVGDTTFDTIRVRLDEARLESSSQNTIHSARRPESSSTPTPAAVHHH